MTSLSISIPVSPETHIRGLTLLPLSQTVQFALRLVRKHTSTRPRLCVITKQNCLLVMLGPIKLYLGTRFLGGLRKLLDFAVLILRCSRHIALRQHLFPKLMKRTSLSMRSWQRHAGSLQRPSVNITTNRLFKETDLLPLSLTSENFDMFLEYYMCYFASFVTVRQYITKMVIIVYAQPLTFVWISCLLFECMSYGCINAFKSYGISAFWSCDRVGKLNETFL